MTSSLVGSKLGTYQVTALLGAGGMGEVYRARDPRLDRDVAIKILPPAVAGDPESLVRFEREARAVAAMSHPNVLGIHELGKDRGLTFAVMELLEGEDLRARIRSGPLREKQALDIALQIARGLCAAHEKGLVHRDLKPENVFVTRSGFVKVLDFGLARHEASTSIPEMTATPTLSALSAPGTVAGTPSYMSPEQVTGRPLDHRSDLFALGVVLYELLTGRKAFERPTTAETTAAILRDEPPEMSAPGRPISPAVERIVRHCLEKDPDRRFQSTQDVVFALEQAAAPGAPHVAKAGPRTIAALAAVLAVGAAIAGALLLRRERPLAAPAARGPRRVAVLPFENLGPAEDDYFAEGVADELRGKLASVGALEVIARASSVAYRKTSKSQRQISEELQTPFLLGGTIRRDRTGTGRLHVSPELVEVRREGPPTSRWQQRFEVDAADVFRVQGEIATHVARELGVPVGESEGKRLSESPTRNLAAYDLFLRASAEDFSDTAGLRRAADYSEKAVALDPGFAEAWARLSMTSSWLYLGSAPKPEVAERARTAAERAISLAPDRPEGHLAMGLVRAMVAGDPAGASEELERARRLAPTDVRVLSAMSARAEFRGRLDESLEYARRAASLDPRSLQSALRLGHALLSLRRHDEAIAAADRALTISPTALGALQLKAAVFLARGDLAGARAVLAAAPAGVDPTALVVTIATMEDLGWMLDRPQQDLLLRLPPAGFGDDAATRALCRAQAYSWRGEAAAARENGEEAARRFEEQIRGDERLKDRRMFLALGLAYAGRKAEALREAEKVVPSSPTVKAGVGGAYMQHQLVRVYILTGEQEKALDALEPLLKVPYLLTPKWLSIDPNFDPLRGNPRFDRLVRGA